MSDKNKYNKLYRIPEQRKIAGVCAGVAERFGYEVWLVRMIVISAFFLGIPFISVLYIAGWLILDIKPLSKDSYEEAVKVKSKIWQQGEPPKVALNKLNTQFQQLELRIQSIESYVSSSEFNLSQKIKQL
ncbi:MAG: envelope stress response membrane protein PspC [Alteromonadales bacterium]|nr:envelope stress response membrane protein PspC [Alteromonadales bacterium]